MTALLLLLLSQQSNLGATNGDLSRSAPLQLLDESVRQGAISELNFAGTGVSCTRTSNRGNCSIDAGAAVGDIELNSTYQTQAALTLYVDRGGNNSNSCLTAALACQTITGALDKIPRFIAHAVTVNIDAGTYTESPTIQDFYARSGATLTLQGQSLIAVTPATGTATGTLTAYTTPTESVIGVMTDSGQSWTTNDLRGRFVRITSGSASGQRRAIVSNTATSLEFAGTFTSNPAAGATYQVETPSTIISGVTTISPNMQQSNVATFILLSQLDFTNATGSSTLNASAATSSLNYASTRLINTSTGVALNAQALRVNTGPVVIMSGSAAAVTVSAQLPSLSPAWQMPGPAGAYIYSSGSSAVSFGLRTTGAIAVANAAVYETGSTSAAVISAIGGNPILTLSATSTAAYGHVRCPVGSTGQGIWVGTNPSFVRSSILPLSGPFGFFNCAVGIRVSGRATVPAINLTFVNTATAVHVEYGGVFNTNASPTYSGVTTQFLIDGVAMTYTEVANHSPPHVTNGATLSQLSVY